GRAVDDDAARGDRRVQVEQPGRGPLAGEVDARVDLVAQDPDLALGGPARNGFQLLARVDGARGVGRRVQDEPAHALVPDGVELVRADLEAAILPARHDHRLRARELDQLRI